MNPTQPTTWTESDFDNLSWHDNHVHAFALREGPDGSGDLTLDIDFIVEWLPPLEGILQYLIAPATLTFREVFGLRMVLDYATPQAGMGPFSLHGINRQVLEYPNGARSCTWRLLVNWPTGELQFSSPGFSQRLRKEPITSASNCLEDPALRLIPGRA